MVLASFVATGFGVAGIHAYLLIKNPQRPSKSLHLKALKIALTFGAIAAFLQPISGDISAKDVAKRQPIKLAAMEAHFNTEKPAHLIVGGIVNEEKETVEMALKIPKLLSFLAFGDFEAEVKGLKDFPKENWPPIAIVRYAFLTMIGIGTGLMILGLLILFALFKWPKLFESAIFLKVILLCTPLGFIAVEAGWVVTEVGRQPWIIYGYMKTKDAVSNISGLQYSFFSYLLLYFLLDLVLIVLMRRQIRSLENSFLEGKAK